MPRNYSFEDATAKTDSEKPRKMEIFTILNNGFQLGDQDITKEKANLADSTPANENNWTVGEERMDDNFSVGTGITISAEEEKAPPNPGSRWRQHLAALLAALSAASVGYVDAWTANALPFLRGSGNDGNGTAEWTPTVSDSVLPFGELSSPFMSQLLAVSTSLPVHGAISDVLETTLAPNLSSSIDITKGQDPGILTVVDGVVRGISSEQASWLSSMVPIGAMVGSIPAGMLADVIGRKVTLLVMVVPCLVSWIIIVFFSHSVGMLYLSRGIAGVIMGVVLVVVPLYNEEIAEVSVRGAIGVYQNMMVTIGILICYVVGACVSYIWTAIIPCAIPITMFLTFIWMPESPTYLFSKNREEEAYQVIGWLRGGKKAIEEDVQQIREAARRARSGQLGSALQMVRRIFVALTRRPSAFALWVVFLLMIFRQLTGIHAVVFYTVEIFEEAKSAVAAPHAAIIIGGVEVASTYLASVLVDKWGRRFLLLASALGATVCHTCLALYYVLLHMHYDLEAFTWLPLLFLALFIIMFACGFGPLPWFMMAELTPSEHKNWASGMSGFLNWGSMFLVLKFFPPLTSLLGEYATFGIFAFNCFTAGVFVYIWVPETKGKTLEEIQEEIASSRS